MTHDHLHRHSTLRIRDIASFIALAIVCLRVGLAIAAPADAAGDNDDVQQVRAVTVKGVAGERPALAFPLSLSVSAAATARTDMATDGEETDAGPRSLAVGVARQVRDSHEIVLGAGIRACLFKHVLIGLEGGLVQGGLAPSAWDLPAATRELITDHRRPEGQFMVTVGVVL